MSVFSHASLYLCACAHVSEPARLFCPWDSPGKNTGVGCHAPPPGDLPDPRIKPSSPVSLALAGRFITTSATWEAQDSGRGYQNCGNTMRKGLWETIQESVHCIREHASSFISSLFYISIFSPLNRKNMLKFLAVVGNIKKKSAPGSPTTSKSC